MTQANRTRLAFIREVVPGTTPNTPKLTKARFKSETLRNNPIFNQSEEIREDRMNDPPTQIMFEQAGGITYEFSYPKDGSFISEMIANLMRKDWTNTPQRDNDGTADSVITDVAATGGVFTVTAGGGDPFVARHLVKTTGFTNAGNNGLFRITTGSDTAPAVGNSLLTDEAAPPAAARIKVVGLEGAEGDLVAVSDGITSTLLNFTTMTGIAVGKWVKIGGTGATYRFATEANNGWARITAVAAGKITLDNLPTGWTADTGEYVTLRIFFGDQILNGTLGNETAISHTFERGFLAQTTPSYLVNTGMQANTGVFSIENRQKINSTLEFLGFGPGGVDSTTPLDASPYAASDREVMSAHVNVGRLAEGGSPISGKNYGRSFVLNVNNNLRAVEDVSQAYAVDINDGECSVTGTLEMYFGSLAIRSKFRNGTLTSFNSRVQKNNQAVIFQVPQATLNENGNPNVTGKNTDVYQSYGFVASKDTLTSAHVLIDRFEYYQT